VLGVELLEPEGDPVLSPEQGRDYLIRVRAVCRHDHPSVSLGFRIETPGGTKVYGTSTSVLGLEVPAKAMRVVAADFTFRCNLKVGEYLVSGSLAQNLSGAKQHDHYNPLHYLTEAAVFSVTGPNKFEGVVDMGSEVSLADAPEQ